MQRFPVGIGLTWGIDEPRSPDPEPPTEAPRPWRAARPRARDSALEHLILVASVRVMSALLVMVLLVMLAWRLRLLLLLIAVALFIAAILHPFVRALTRRGMGRVGATLTVYAVLAVLALAVGYLLVHPVYDSATRFAQDLPSLVRQAQQGRGQVGRIVARLHLVSYVEAHAPALRNDIAKLGKPALAVGKTVLSGVVGVVTIVFISFFLLLELPLVLRSGLRLLEPRRQELIRHIAQMMSRQVAGFMIGDFATSVVAGVVVFTSLRLTGVPFASVLAIWVALVDFLPLVGGLLGGVPAIGVAFLHSLTAGIITVVLFLVYQQVENHFLNPMIIARTVRLNPLWVLLSVLLGAEVGGIVGSTFGAMCGAIFAVPLAGAVQVTVHEVVAAREAREAPSAGLARPDASGAAH